jgi:glycosyltransferase involved in cell wall biosynthesis
VIREANRSADDTRARAGLQTWLNRTALRVLYPRADAIIALSAGLAAHLREIAPIMPAKITVIPNPAPAPVMGASAPRAGSVPLVLACGRLEQQKDFSTLLEAFSRIRALRAARLAILGTGSLEGQLRDQARALGIDASVDFAGHVEDVHAWMRRASVFALSSRWEGFPNVLLEALSQRCPVVATDCSDAVSEVLADGKLGAIVPIGDADALATALLAVIDGQRRYDDPSAHLAHYAIDKIARRYLDVLAVAASRTV